MAKNLKQFHKLSGQCFTLTQRKILAKNIQIKQYSKFTSTTPNQNQKQSLDDVNAYELVLNLDASERTALKTALDKLESNVLKQKLEGELAATRWRTKFARPSTSKLGDVDPTGAYCAMPEDWLKRKAEENAKRPESGDLWKLFFVNAVPFVGFGFLDNFIMIAAGDSIEHVFGTFFCLSTMAAAGLGNTISDVVGIGSASYIERGCEALGLRPPKLSTIQMEMKSSRRYANWGRILGITFGCLLGMCPLWFVDKKKGDEAEPENSAS